MPAQKRIIKLPADLAADAQAVARLWGEDLETMVVKIVTAVVENVKSGVVNPSRPSRAQPEVASEPETPAPPEPPKPDDGGKEEFEAARRRAEGRAMASTIIENEERRRSAQA